MLRILMAAIIAMLTGCHSSERPKQTELTPSCYKYQLMMTAPMPEEAMQRLKLECENSHTD
ncbi:hypothetical protein [Klebsiella sp. BIGb0407]|uniref:hypothetical protein n=1 Tax=Klebsiella sp. BIGb0407 TaxID=2940603 RepID=UPI00216A37A2|nr:hypothetical protein [Klebsiella sp. BIGb0407]MCS3430086.1 hypothetical protein [Klebsiella sp. BIGb0407]